MIRQYPYLVDKYFEADNNELSKKNFLSTLDSFVNQKQYIKIILLNWDENPIKEIQGELSGGSLTKTKDNCVRCTGNLECVMSSGDYNIDDIKMDYSINKKVFIEIGIRNDTGHYPDYPILWFPQGVFFIGGISVSSSDASVKINISLKDKMAMLDGSIGGRIPSAVQLDSVLMGMSQKTKKVLVYDIILELVHHFGGEPYDRIVIEDIPETIKTVLKWNSKESAYFYSQPIVNSNGEIEIDGMFYLYDDVFNDRIEDSLKEEILTNGITCSTGMNIGYTITDFVYNQGELSLPAGATVTEGLDQIKNWLNNYEYFYDEYGIFHFREVKDYSYTSFVTELLSDTELVNELASDSNGKYYLTESSFGKSIYTFNDDNMSSLQITPKYENIKNDFIVHGTRTIADTGATEDIMYHLVIDEKPAIDPEGYSNILIYEETPGHYNVCSPIPIQLQEDEIEPSTSGAQSYEVGSTCAWVGKKDSQVTKNFSTYEEIYDYTNRVLDRFGGNGEDFYSQTAKIAEDLYARISYLKDILSEDELDSYYAELAKLLIIGNLNPDDLKISNFNKDEYMNLYMSKKNIPRLRRDSDDISNSLKILDLWTDMIGESGKLLTLYKEMSANYSPINDTDMYAAYQKIIKGYEDFYENVIKEIIKVYKTVFEMVKSPDSSSVSYTTSEIEWSESLRVAVWDGVQWQYINWHTYYPDGEIIKTPHHSITLTQEDFNSSFGTPSTDITSSWYKDYYIEKAKENNKINSSEKIFYYENPENLYHYVANDWRTEIVLRGITTDNLSLDSGSYYFTELLGHWYKCYDYINNKMFSPKESSNNYFLDIIDERTEIYGEYSVNNIGRRPIVEQSDTVNCLFSPEIPQYLFFENTGEEWSQKDLDEKRKAAEEEGYSFVQLDSDVYSNLSQEGTSNYSAYDRIKTLLLQHTNYQKQISISSIPVFYLEPNRRVSVKEKSTNTYQDIVLASISFSFGPGSGMNCSGTEVIEYLI